MDASLTTDQLQQSLSGSEPPLVIDVRREAAFRSAATLIAGALRRDPETVDAWLATLPQATEMVVYCVHGHAVSQGVQTALAASGRQARFLAGGIEAWAAAGGGLDRKPSQGATRWVTRERPKVDRIACPWLVRRFVDPGAEFLFVPPGEVLSTARERDAAPYDVPDVAFTHDGPRCSFDAFIGHFRLRDPALQTLATIVRGADTGCPDLAPEAAGLAAVSLGLSRLFTDDLEMLEHGMTLYDALYLWCRDGRQERHTWNPLALR